MPSACRIPARDASLGAAQSTHVAGWLTLALRLEDVWHASPQLLQLGPDAQVIDPPELRETIASAARTMAALYG